MGKAIKQKTQAKILVVEDASNSKAQKYTIKADIPEFSKFETDYITWYKDSGDPPKEGALVIAELHPSSRKGKVADKLGSKAVDGSEEAWDVYWEMVGVEPLANENRGDNESVHSKPTGNITNAPVRQTSNGTNQAVWVDAELRYRIEYEMKNIRDAIWMTLKHGETSEGSNLYADIKTVIKESQPLVDHLNNHFVARLYDGNVKDAMDAGAVISEVVAEPEPVITEPADDLFPPDKEGRLPSGNLSPKIWKTKKSFKEWMVANKWSGDQVRRVLSEKADCKSNKAMEEYLAKEGNTLEGLAKLLNKELNW